MSVRKPLTEDQKARQSLRNKAWREANREVLLEKKGEYYRANRDKAREHNKAWRESNVETVSAGKRSYWERNGARDLARRRSRYDPLNALRRALLANYGLGLDEANALLASQNFACSVCGQEFEHSFELAQQTKDTHRKPNVDHNHASGKIRAILCGRCNKALGFAREDKDILAKLIEYLERHGQ